MPQILNNNRKRKLEGNICIVDDENKNSTRKQNENFRPGEVLEKNWKRFNVAGACENRKKGANKKGFRKSPHKRGPFGEKDNSPSTVYENVSTFDLELMFLMLFPL